MCSKFGHCDKGENVYKNKDTQAYCAHTKGGCELNILNLRRRISEKETDEVCRLHYPHEESRKVRKDIAQFGKYKERLVFLVYREHLVNNSLHLVSLLLFKITFLVLGKLIIYHSLTKTK